MCDQCENKNHAFPALTAKRRLKLWETKPHFHCAILGTCLSVDDLRKVMRQSGVVMQNAPTDYDLHAMMVGQAEEKSRASRNLHKMLDRKYKRWIQALSKYKESDDLVRYWDEAMESGELPGAFWAIMTHPYAEAELIRKTYEDVHMMSHLQGASNRADLKRMKVLEEKVSELQDVLGKVRQNHNEQLTRRDELVQQQEQELMMLKVTGPRISVEKCTGETVEDIDRQNRLMCKRVDWAETQLAQRDVQMAELQEEIAGLKELLAETREEHGATEQILALLLSEKSDGLNEQDREIDLRGKRVLYVGGRSTLAPHLRSLVEAHNGRFNHHDGGLEDSRAGLNCTLAGADMVFCPVDCISHDACRRVKRHCQQQAKPFIPLRSSGLSAFAAGLKQYSVTQGGQQWDAVIRTP